MDADDLLLRARDALGNCFISHYLSDRAMNELAREAAIFASQFAGECIKELQPRVEAAVKEEL